MIFDSFSHHHQYIYNYQLESSVAVLCPAKYLENYQEQKVEVLQPGRPCLKRLHEYLGDLMLPLVVELPQGFLQTIKNVENGTQAYFVRATYTSHWTMASHFLYLAVVRFPEKGTDQRRDRKECSHENLIFAIKFQTRRRGLILSLQNRLSVSHLVHLAIVCLEEKGTDQ